MKYVISLAALLIATPAFADCEREQQELDMAHITLNILLSLPNADYTYAANDFNRAINALDMCIKIGYAAMHVIDQHPVNRSHCKLDELCAATMEVKR